MEIHPMPRFINDLEFADSGETYKGRPVITLTKDLLYAMDKGEEHIITVPKGFVTDFASIPRLLFILASPSGRHRRAAVLHDYLFTEKSGISRIVCDAIFYDAMRAEGVAWWRRVAIFSMVRLFGYFFYPSRPPYIKEVENEEN